MAIMAIIYGFLQKYEDFYGGLFQVPFIWPNHTSNPWGEDTHPWSATKVGNPIPATIPVDQDKKTTKKLLKPATMQSTAANFFKSCFDIKVKKVRL